MAGYCERISKKSVWSLGDTLISIHNSSKSQPTQVQLNWSRPKSHLTSARQSFVFWLPGPHSFWITDWACGLWGSKPLALSGKTWPAAFSPTNRAVLPFFFVCFWGKALDHSMEAWGPLVVFFSLTGWWRFCKVSWLKLKRFHEPVIKTYWLWQGSQALRCYLPRFEWKL